MGDVFLGLYLDVAFVVLNAASWVLDLYIEVLERWGGWLTRWQETRIVRVGPWRVKFHREYVLLYTPRRPLLCVRFGRGGRGGDDG